MIQAKRAPEPAIPRPTCTTRGRFCTGRQTGRRSKLTCTTRGRFCTGRQTGRRSARVGAKSSEAGPRPADEQSCGLSLDLYKSPDPQNRCVPCRRCLPRSLRQTKADNADKADGSFQRPLVRATRTPEPASPGPTCTTRGRFCTTRFEAGRRSVQLTQSGVSSS